MLKRENIRKVTPQNQNSFYDCFKKRNYKESLEYKIVAGITKATFKKGKS